MLNLVPYPVALLSGLRLTLLFDFTFIFVVTDNTLVLVIILDLRNNHMLIQLKSTIWGLETFR